MIIYVLSTVIPTNTTIHYSTGRQHRFDSEVEEFTYPACDGIVLAIARNLKFYFTIKLKNLIDNPITKVEYPS
jgi:hypothetical protein